MKNEEIFEGDLLGMLLMINISSSNIFSNFFFAYKILSKLSDTLAAVSKNRVKLYKAGRTSVNIMTLQ